MITFSEGSLLQWCYNWITSALQMLFVLILFSFRDPCDTEQCTSGCLTKSSVALFKNVGNLKPYSSDTVNIFSGPLSIYGPLPVFHSMTNSRTIEHKLYKAP